MQPIPELKIEVVKTEDLIPYANNAKLHPHEQIDQIAASIEEFGNCDPIAIWHNAQGEPEIVEGHGRLMALKKLDIKQVPVICLDHLTDKQRRTYALIHNKLTMDTGFDVQLLINELNFIESTDMTQYGFTPDIFAFDIGELLTDDQPQEDAQSKTIEVVCECCGETFNVKL